MPAVARTVSTPPGIRHPDEGGAAPTLAITAWRPLRKGHLAGFASVRLRNGLVIHDVSVFSMHGGRSWANFPGRPMLGPDGRALKTDTGKIRYANLLEWPDKVTADRFSASVVSALERQYPGALGGEREL